MSSEKKSKSKSPETNDKLLSEHENLIQLQKYIDKKDKTGIKTILDTIDNINKPIKQVGNYSLLYWACEHDYRELFDILINDNRVNIYGDSEDDFKPIHIACLKNREYIVKKIIEKDEEKFAFAMCNIKSANERLGPIDIACLNNNIAIFKILIEAYKKAKINTRGETVRLDRERETNDLGETCLHMACRLNHIEIVDIILNSKLYIDINYGPDVEVLNKKYKNFTALHMAAMFANKEIILKLIEKGADPYSMSFEKGDINIVKHEYIPYSVLCDFAKIQNKNDKIMNKYDEIINLFIKNEWHNKPTYNVKGYCEGKERIYYAKKGEEYKNPLHPRSPSKSPSKKSTSKKSPSKGGNFRKTRKIKNDIMGWLFAKKKPIETFGLEGSAVRDKTELDEYPFLEGERYKVKGRKPKEIVVNMKFAPWEEGFRPPNNDPYGDGPYLEKDGKYNRVVSREPGSRNRSTPANRSLANAYDRNAKIIKDKQNIEHNSATRKNSRSTSKKSPSKSKGGKIRKK